MQINFVKPITALVKKEPTIFLFSKLWRFSAGNRKSVLLFLTLFLFSNLTSLLGPLIFSAILNEIQKNGITSENISKILLMIPLIVLVTMLFWVFHGIGRVVERKNAFYVKLAYREYLLSGVLAMGLPWHGARDSGDTIDKINKAVTGLYSFSGRIFLVMEILIKIIGTSVVLYFFNPYIGLFVVPFIALSFFTLFQFDIRLIKQYKGLNLFDNKISAKIFDALSNVTSVIILDVRDPIMKNIRRVMTRPRLLYGENAKLNEYKWFTGSIFFDLLVILPLMFYVLYVYKNNTPIQIGTISALYLYLSRLSEVFFTFSGFYEDVIVDKTSVQNITEIEESFVPKNIKRKKTPEWKNITITNILFRYEDVTNNSKHLNNVSLKIKKGERIACIGESGSGKTTFLKVLHGLYPTTTASIMFDNKKQIQTNFSDINLHTMLVPQEPELFSASIEENITFGVDYSQTEIQEAISLAQFSDVVKELPNKLQSIINEKGVNLSGGQKQRLALARALLFAKNKDILLLDESTSSVDPKNEAKIYETIFKKFKNKTILASIHKMNLLRYFDRIIIFEKGTIIDEGTFDELLIKNQSFKKNWDDFVTITE